MSGSVRKGVMALLGSVVLAGLVMPGSADAATVPSVKVKVCNNASESQGFRLAGRNQDGNWYEQPTFRGLFPNECGVFDNRWATGQHLQVYYFRNLEANGTPRAAKTTGYLSKDFRNGITVTVNVSWLAP